MGPICSSRTSDWLPSLTCQSLTVLQEDRDPAQKLRVHTLFARCSKPAHLLGLWLLCNALLLQLGQRHELLVVVVPGLVHRLVQGSNLLLLASHAHALRLQAAAQAHALRLQAGSSTSSCAQTAGRQQYKLMPSGCRQQPKLMNPNLRQLRVLMGSDCRWRCKLEMQCRGRRPEPHKSLLTHDQLLVLQATMLQVAPAGQSQGREYQSAALPLPCGTHLMHPCCRVHLGRDKLVVMRSRFQRLTMGAFDPTSAECRFAKGTHITL